MGKIPFCSAIAALLAGCVAIPEYPPRVTAQLQSGAGAVAYSAGAFRPAGPFGTAVFEPAGNKVHVIVSAEGLTPGEQYGLRIHNTGDCSRGASEPHALASLRADNLGRATVEADVDGATVTAGDGSMVGRGLAIHGGPEAGTHVACGAIRAG